MKKTIRIIVLAFAVMITVLPSCSKTKNQIVGKWEMTYLTSYGERVEFRDVYLNFKENGSVRLSGEIDSEYLDFTSKWVVKNDELVIKGGDIDWEEEGYYILQLDIDELTEETLELDGRINVYDHDQDELVEFIPVRASFERK